MAHKGDPLLHPTLGRCTWHSAAAHGTHVDAHDGQIDVVEQLVVELDRHAAAEEHHHLLLPVLLQECEQQHEPLLRGTHHVPATQRQGDVSTDHRDAVISTRIT